MFRMGDKICKKDESFETALKYNRRVLWANEVIVFYAYDGGVTEQFSSAPPEDFVIMPQPKRPVLKVGDTVRLAHSVGKQRFRVLYLIDEYALIKDELATPQEGTLLQIELAELLEPIGWGITRIDWDDDTTWRVTITGTGKIPDWMGETDHPLS